MMIRQNQKNKQNKTIIIIELIITSNIYEINCLCILFLFLILFGLVFALPSSCSVFFLLALLCIIIIIIFFVFFVLCLFIAFGFINVAWLIIIIIIITSKNMNCHLHQRSLKRLSNWLFGLPLKVSETNNCKLQAPW